MKIGITCYPTCGGSEALATELGIKRAEREHEIHSTPYGPPLRLELPSGSESSGVSKATHRYAVEHVSADRVVPMCADHCRAVPGDTP